VEELERAMESKAEELEKVGVRARAMEEELSSKTLSLSESSGKVHDAHESIRRYTTRIDELEASLKREQDDSREAESKIEDLTSELEELRKNLDNLSHEKNIALEKTSAREEEAAKAKQHISVLEKELDDKRARLEEIESSKKAREQEHRDRIGHLESHLNSARDESAALQARIKELEAEMTATEKTISSSRKYEERYNRTVEQHRFQVQELEKRLEIAISELQSEKKKRKRAEEDARQLREEIRRVSGDARKEIVKLRKGREMAEDTSRHLDEKASIESDVLRNLHEQVAYLKGRLARGEAVEEGMELGPGQETATAVEPEDEQVPQKPRPVPAGDGTAEEPVIRPILGREEETETVYEWPGHAYEAESRVTGRSAQTPRAVDRRTPAGQLMTNYIEARSPGSSNDKGMAHLDQALQKKKTWTYTCICGEVVNVEGRWPPYGLKCPRCKRRLS
jgi:hypothetical protein